MKIRTDFVSNSSSSSFIVLHKDNKYGLLLDGDDVDHWNLDQFLEYYGETEFLGYNMYGEKQKMTFVTDKQFLKLFLESDGDGMYLPKCCKQMYDDILALREERERLSDEHDLNWNDPQINKLLNAEDSIVKKIMVEVKGVLQPVYGNEIFDHQSISDNDCFEDDSDSCYSEEDKAKERIEFAASRMPDFKFYRYYCEH